MVLFQTSLSTHLLAKILDTSGRSSNAQLIYSTPMVRAPETCYATATTYGPHTLLHVNIVDTHTPSFASELAFETSAKSVVVYRANNTSPMSINVYSQFENPEALPQGLPPDFRHDIDHLPSLRLFPESERNLVAPPALIQ